MEEWCSNYGLQYLALPIASDGKLDEFCFTETKPKGTDKEINTIIGIESAADNEGFSLSGM